MTPPKPYLWALRPYFRQVAGQLVVGSLCGIVMNTMIVLPAILLGRAIDAALAFSRGEVAAADVGWAAALLVLGTLGSEGPRIGKRWWLMTANARIRSSLRADALRGILSWPLEQTQSVPIGELMARVIGDVEVLGVGVREFTIEMWDTVLFSISLVVSMLFYDAGLTVLALLPVPAAMILAKATGRWVSQRTTRTRVANAALTATLQEDLAGVRVLRLFGHVTAAVEHFAGLSRVQAETNLATVRLRGGLQPVYSTLMTAGILLIVWLGGERVIAGAMTVGAFVGYIELYLRFVNRGFRVPQLVNSVQSGGAAYARLKPLLASPLAVAGERPYASFRPGHINGLNAPATLPSSPLSGPVAVNLRNVTFEYPGGGRPALTGVSLQVPAGSLVAVTGPVGSGKSALARAILGLYPLAGGVVEWDGRSLSDILADERAARAGYLPQDPYLVSGTVRENILFGQPACDEATVARFVQGVLDAASLQWDVAGFPQQLDTELGELGTRASGGQRQRIALARAMASACPRVPGLLVLDDPFSAVDVDTEAQIVSALRDVYGWAARPEERATIVLCSHRLAAFPQADLVMVLDGGRVAEQGTHAELAAAGGLYARIFQAQCRVDGYCPEGEEAE